MSANLDERIVSIKFDNSGFEEKASETQKQLEDLNKSLEFDNAKKGVSALTDAFKNIEVEAKKVDVSPISEGVENIKEKFNVLQTVATGVLYKIGADAVEMGKKLIKSVSIDPIAQGFEKYQSILTSQMTLTAALGGQTEEEIADNEAKIKDVLDELAWYADETSYSLDDMVKNVSQFANYGIDLEDAKTAMMGIANASAKSGAPLALASHAMEGFSKAMGQGYMSYQVWRTWLNSSKITTIDFKNTMIDTAKAFAKEAGSIGNAAYENGELIVDMGKTMGKVQVTAENLESTLTKGRWLTKDVMLAALSKYSAAMDDFYEATDHGKMAVSELFDNSEAGFDKFSTEAFKYAQQCKTLNDVIEALFDATSTTWYRIFQSLIGDYKQTVSMWSDFAEYLFEWFVYPLQDVASMIKEFAEDTSSIIDEATGKAMTFRDLIVGSFMNILKAIKSVIDPIKEAFNAVFNPLERGSELLKNGTERFYKFTESLILSDEESEKLRITFIKIFEVLKTVWNIIKSIADIVKKYVFPVIKTVAGFTIKIISFIASILFKLVSSISSFISRIFGITDYVAEMKEDILEAAESIDALNKSAKDSEDAFDSALGTYTDYNDVLSNFIMNAFGATDALNDLTDAEEKNAKASKKNSAANKSYILPDGYDGQSYLTYQQALEKANNKALAEYIKEKKITEKQYEKLIEMLKIEDETGTNFIMNEMMQATGLQGRELADLLNIIRETRTAYYATDKAISRILNKDKEAAKWETIWDGIAEAEKETLITYGDSQAALDLYFKQGIKDYSQISEAIGVEEWKIRRVIDAYKEALAVEKLLAKQQKEATADNIDAARQELGYIKRKNEEKEKERKQTERDISIAERNARIQERNKRVQRSTTSNTSKATKVISNAIKQIPIVGDAFNILGKVFGSVNKNIDKTSKSTKNISNEIRNSIDEVNLANADMYVTSKKNFYETSESADETAESIKTVGETTSNAADAVLAGTSSIKDSFQGLEKDVKDSSTNVSKSIKEISDTVDKSKSGDKDSLVSKIQDIFDSDKSLDLSAFKGKLNELPLYLKTQMENIWKEINTGPVGTYVKELMKKYDPQIVKIKEFFSTFSVAFAQLQKDFDGFLDDPIKSISDAIETIRGLFAILWAQIFRSGNKPGTLGAMDVLDEKKTTKSLKDSISRILKSVWEFIKGFFKNIWDELVNDKDGPFYEYRETLNSIPDTITKVINKIKSTFKQLKNFFKTLFGKGTLIEKFASGSIYQPLIAIFDDFVNTIDNAKKKWEEFKDSVKTGWEKSLNESAGSFAKKIDEIEQKFKNLRDQIKNFFKSIGEIFKLLDEGVDKKTIAKDKKISIHIINLLDFFNKIQNRIEKGLDWETILKVKELEPILADLVKTITSAWIALKITDMANDVKNFFTSISDGITKVIKSYARDKKIGKTLLEIGIAVALVAESLIRISKADPNGIDKAKTALMSITFALTAMFAIVMLIIKFLGPKSALTKSGSISEAVTNLVDRVFGSQSTITKAARILLYVAGAIYLMSLAFVKIAEFMTKDNALEAASDAMQFIWLIAGVVVILLVAIQGLSKIFTDGTKGLVVGKLEITKGTGNLRKALLTIALLIAVIGGFALLLIKAIDKYFYKINEDGTETFNEEKFNLVRDTFIQIMGITALIIFGTLGLEKVLSKNDWKPSFGSDISKMLWPIIVSVLAMVWAFKSIVKTIDKIERPKTWSSSMATLGLMMGGLIAMAAIIMILAKVLSGKKLSKKTSKQASEWIKESFAYIPGKGQMRIKLADSDITEAAESGSGLNKSELNSAVALVVAIASSIRLLASAFNSIVETTDSIKRKKTWRDSLIVLGIAVAAILGSLAVIMLLSNKVSSANAESLMLMASLFSGVLALSLVVIIDAVGKYVKSMNKLKNVDKDNFNKSMNTLIAIIAIVVGGMAAIFVILAALSGTGVGAGVIAVAAIGIIALAGAIWLVADAVKRLAEGLDMLVDFILKVDSASDQIESGLNRITELAPKFSDAVASVIKAIAEGVWKARIYIYKAVFDLISGLGDYLDEKGPELEEKLKKVLPTLDRIVKLIKDGYDDPKTGKHINGLSQSITELGDSITGTIANVLSKAFTNFLTAESNQTEERASAIVKIVSGWIRGVGDKIEELNESINYFKNKLFDQFCYNLFGVKPSEQSENWDYSKSVFYNLGGRIVESMVFGFMDWITGSTFFQKISSAISGVGGFLDTMWTALGFSGNRQDKKGASGGAGSNPEIENMGANLGEGLIIGLVNWLKKNHPTIGAWAAKILAFLGGGLEEKSPSKATIRMGEYLGEGLKIGMDNSTKSVEKSAEQMGKATLNSLTGELDTFSAVTSSMLSQMLDADMEFNPVITPVFDMSNLDDANDQIGNVFNNNSAGVLSQVGSSTSLNDSNKLIQLAASQQMISAQNKIINDLVSKLENYQNAGQNAAPTYNYTQNNYSPKALSEIEIYRRTNNQLNFRKFVGG